MKRKKYIVGNWKMFKTADTAYNDFLILQNLLEAKNELDPAAKPLDDTTKFHVGICAPAVFLQQLADISTHIDIYAQNVFWENEGAFTGEISVPMLQSINVSGSLVGHSERRQYFHETNSDCGKKLQALLKNNMKAIYCVGETLQEREEDRVEEVIATQLHEALGACRGEIGRMDPALKPRDDTKLLSIAYEPVWAIGTGKAATAQDAHNVHTFIRKTIAKIFNDEIAQNTRILYGGSVKTSNAKEFLMNDEIDGALVGGASLNPNDFFKLCCS